MRLTEERRIGENDYRVQQLELNAALALVPIVLRCAGPTLAALIEGSKSVSDVVDGEGAVVATAVREFARSLSSEDLITLSDALAKGSKVCNAQGVWLPLDSVAKSHFPPRYQEWMLWLLFAVEVNFASFFGAAGSVESFLGALRKAQASPSPTASTGTDGV